MEVTYLEPKSDSFERLKFENEILLRETNRLYIKYKKNPTEANHKKYSDCLMKASDATLLYSRAFNLHYDIESHLRIV